MRLSYSLSPWPSAKVVLHMSVIGQDYQWLLTPLFQNLVLFEAVIL